MDRNIINPAKPDEIVKEIFCGNNNIIDEFSKNFSPEILNFAESYAEGYKKYLELNRLITNCTNKQRAYVAGLTYLLLENLLISFKLFIMGLQIPSGNLMRQVIETVALSTLCSLDFDITVKYKGKEKSMNFFECFTQQKSVAKSHKAIFYLESNSISIGIKKDAIDTLKSARKFYHNYSHPSLLGMANVISFKNCGDTFIGGSFDLEKIDKYKKELVHRVNFCKILPNFIEGIISKVKQLPCT